ncbi:lasso RiPP family leader peptide-containing protein [Nonomuraea angiospora]
MIDNEHAEPYEPPQMLEIGEFGQLTRGYGMLNLDGIFYYPG